MGNSTSTTRIASHEGSSRLPTAAKLHPRPVLSDREAWAIALAWRSQLRGCVRLEEESVCVPATIIRSFEWVTFVFNGVPEQGFQEVKDTPMMTAYARAATIAWFALSCCEGYSGTENPEFWKRVFLEFLYPRNRPNENKRVVHPHRGQLIVSEAVRFFDASDKPFPRVKLVVEYKAETKRECTRIILGMQAYPDKSRDHKLQRILAKLKPFIRRGHWKRPIPVAIDELGPEMVEALLVDNTTRGEIVPEPAPLMELPRMKLYSVELHDPGAFSVFDGLREKLPACDVTVRTRLSLWNIVHDRRLARSLLCEVNKDVNQVPHPPLDAYWLFMMQSVELSCSYLGVLCSATPYLKSIKQMTLPSFRYSHGRPSSPASDWAWLGFAIFHPDAADTSGFVTLDIETGGVSSADLEALQRMATGNNLLSDLNGSSWIEGYVPSATQVWTDPRDDADLLHTFRDAAWICLCVPTTDVLEFREWVCAVIPGYGLGWIRRGDVVETRSRPPGRSCIRVLRMNAQSCTLDINVLSSLLTVLGSSLTTLDVVSSKRLSASTVRVIVTLCPALKCLRIHHDGSFWAEDSAVTPSSCIEELQLTINWRLPPSRVLTPMNLAALPRLKALRVVGWYDISFQQHQLLLKLALHQHRGLQYLHWSSYDDLMPTWVDDSYHRMHKATRKFQRQLQDPTMDFCDVPLTLECRLAFLSVGRQSTSREVTVPVAVGLLGQDMFTIIFDFATSTKKREIFIAL